MTLAFLDTETTGLDVATHDAWCVSYAIDDAPIVTHALPHTLTGAVPEALEINGYHALQPTLGDAAPDVVDQLATDLTGVTLVGANPRFDAAMLAKLIGHEPWHYRLVDVCTAVMYLEGWPEPRGLLGCAYAMRHRGIKVPLPDHTSAGDVATVRAIHAELRDLMPVL